MIDTSTTLKHSPFMFRWHAPVLPIITAVLYRRETLVVSVASKRIVVVRWTVVIAMTDQANNIPYQR